VFRRAGDPTHAAAPTSTPPRARPDTCHVPTGHRGTCHVPTRRPAACHPPTGATVLPRPPQHLHGSCPYRPPCHLSCSHWSPLHVPPPYPCCRAQLNTSTYEAVAMCHAPTGRPTRGSSSLATLPRVIPLPLLQRPPQHLHVPASPRVKSPLAAAPPGSCLPHHVACPHWQSYPCCIAHLNTSTCHAPTGRLPRHLSRPHWPSRHVSPPYPCCRANLKTSTCPPRHVSHPHW